MLCALRRRDRVVTKPWIYQRSLHMHGAEHVYLADCHEWKEERLGQSARYALSRLYYHRMQRDGRRGSSDLGRRRRLCVDVEQKISRVTTAKQCCTGFRRFYRAWKDADGWWKAVDSTSLIHRGHNDDTQGTYLMILYNSETAPFFTRAKF